MYTREIAPILVSLCAVLFISGMFWFRSYTGLRFWPGFVALVGSVAACGYMGYQHLEGGREAKFHTMTGQQLNEFEVYFPAMAAGAIMVFGAALVLRLWGRWVDEKATAEERQPGLPGVRAWFKTANVMVAILIVVCGWFGYEFSPLVSAVGLAGVLAAAPLLRIEWPAAAPAPLTEDMSAEREKILSMLESGKLTADESAELLQALGASTHAPPREVTLTGGQRLMLVGAALVTVGFFLPWFVVNPGAEAGQMFNQMQKSLSSTGLSMPSLSLNTSTVSVSGGDIGRGLGWATLVLALAAALLPYLANTLQATTARTVRLLCLGIGGLIVLYLFTQNIRYAGIGLMIAVGGYVVETAGMLRERSGVRI